MNHVDICLLRDENDEPCLAIAPAWKVDPGDLLIVENQEGRRYEARVQTMHTTEMGGEIYEFVASVFGERPESLKAVQRMWPQELIWDN